MKKYEYLNEERYQKSKKKIALIAVVIFFIGATAGGTLIYLGISKAQNVNSSYSDENKESLNTKLNEEKKVLETRKEQLKSSGVEYDATANYDEGNLYELKIITDVLNPGFDYCKFSEYKNNDITANYCSLKNQIEDANSEFNKSWDMHKSIPYYMFGAFIIIASCMISGSIYMITKRRELLAFSAQQVMPIAQEGIDQMAPSAGKVAKEIAKGIKDGMKD